MSNKSIITFPALATVLLLAFHAAAGARDLPKETTFKPKPEPEPKAVEPVAAPASAGEEEKNFIAFGGVGAAAGMGGVVGVIPIGNLGGSGLPGGLGGLPLPGGLGGDPGVSGVCGNGGGLAGDVGRKPVVPLVP